MTLLKIPIEIASVPTTGFVYVNKYWWIVEPGCVVFFTSLTKLDSIKRDLHRIGFDVAELSPQCNSSISVLQRLHPSKLTPYSGPVYFGAVQEYLLACDLEKAIYKEGR